MMAVYCDELGKRALLDLSSLTSVTGTDGHVTFTYRCLCGRFGRVLSGRQVGWASGHLS